MSSSSTTLLLLVVAALLLTGLANDAHGVPTSPPSQQCTCAASSPPTGTISAAAAAADVPDFADCLIPIDGMWPCREFLTGSSLEPGSACCAEMAAFFHSATVKQLKCLCPIIRGEIFAKVDLLRIISLPSACNVVVPSQLVQLCLDYSSRSVKVTAAAADA